MKIKKIKKYFSIMIVAIVFFACPPGPDPEKPTLFEIPDLEKNVVFATNNAFDYLTKEFQLPLELDGTMITWSSDSPNLIVGGDGKATIIRSEKTDISGTLTAIIEYKGIKTFKKFDFTIKKKGVIELMDHIQFTPPDTRTTVTKDFTVKLTVSEAGTDYTLEWSSDNTTVLSFAGTVGKITRPDWNQDNTTVKITVKITSAGKTTNENFNIIILSKDAPTVTMEKNIFRKVFEDDMESYSTNDDLFAKRDKDGKHRYTLTYYEWHFYKNGIKIKENQFGRTGKSLAFNQRMFNQADAENPAILGPFNEDYSYLGIPPYSSSRWGESTDGGRGANNYNGVLSGGMKMGKKFLYGYVECEIYLPPKEWRGPWAGFWLLGRTADANGKFIAGYEPDLEFLSNNNMWIHTHIVSTITPLDWNNYNLDKSMYHGPNIDVKNTDLINRGCLTGNLHGQWIKFAILWTPHLYQIRINDKPFMSIVDDKMWYERKDNPNWRTDPLEGNALAVWNKLSSLDSNPFSMINNPARRSEVRSLNDLSKCSPNSHYNVIPNVPMEVIWSCNNDKTNILGGVDPGVTNKGLFRNTNSSATVGTEWDHFLVDNIKYYEWIGLAE